MILCFLYNLDCNMEEEEILNCKYLDYYLMLFVE